MACQAETFAAAEASATCALSAVSSSSSNSAVGSDSVVVGSVRWRGGLLSTCDAPRTTDGPQLSCFVRPIASAAIGLAAFGGPWPLVAAAAALPWLVAGARTRAGAFTIALAYHLAASRGLAVGAAQFYGTPVAFGAVIWTAGNLLSAAVYALGWSARRSHAAIGVALTTLLLAVPPFGVLGWANPLTAAGVVYPGLGLGGLVLMVAVFIAAIVAARRMLVALLVASGVANLVYEPPTTSWQAIDTGVGPPAADFEADYIRQLAAMQAVGNSEAPVVLLPEGTNLLWASPSRQLWADRRPAGRTVVLGTTLPPTAGRSEQAVLVVLDDAGETVYRQRQPVPLSMWKPWSADTYEADWFAPPTVRINGVEAAPLICYEAFLVWPVVTSLGGGASAIMVASNLWWAKSTSLPAIQRTLVTSWARLFRVPFTMAVNT